MKKILTSEQIRRWDQFTITHEPIISLDLMERASNAFVDYFLQLFEEKQTVRIFCGVGNNGGDGLAIGRLLKQQGWEVLIYVVGSPKDGTEDFKANLDRSELYAVIQKEEDFPQFSGSEIVIDALFGSGLSRPLEGLYAEVVKHINGSAATKVSIDIASGLYADRAVEETQTIVKSDHTISFQVPKLAFFLPDSHPFVGEWKVVDIGLHPKFLQEESTNFFLTEKVDVKSFIPSRTKFTHKTQVGKLLIVAGSKGKMGAAVLCTRAAFASGVGLINVCSPACGMEILQVAIPEAMVMEDPDESKVTKIPKTADTVIVGPGLGTAPETLKAFESFLIKSDHPMVIDADGLNLLAKKKSLLKHLPEDSILTPHPGEFKRLVGDWTDDFEKLEKLRSFCLKHKVNAVLKGAYSAICDKQGKVYFNSTGNPALATAGSGDVLAGVVGSFVAQGVAPANALRLGVYIHGLAGDLAVKQQSYLTIVASQLIDFLPAAIGSLSKRVPLD